MQTHILANKTEKKLEKNNDSREPQKSIAFLGCNSAPSSGGSGFGSGNGNRGGATTVGGEAAASAARMGLSLGRAELSHLPAWRQRGLDAIPANLTAKFKAPCWYYNSLIFIRIVFLN